MLPSPTQLFLSAQAFYFSNARGRCFSPGWRSLLQWYGLCLKSLLWDRTRLKRLRLLWEAY